MNATDLVDRVMADVRAILRNYEPSMSRHALDVFLGDFERDLHRAIGDLIEREIGWARLEWEHEMEDAQVSP
jgi:hypothetical protein